MKKLYPTVVLCLLILSSCKFNDDAKLEKKIIGEWTLTKVEDSRSKKGINQIILLPSFYQNPKKGYLFAKTGLCENKIGYFIKKADRNQYFLGTKTKFRIENGNLNVFNLSDSSWNKQKIISIDKDTLSLQLNDYIVEKYTRAKYKIDENEKYDEIILASSGCYGTCPIMNISIKRDGEVVFFGEQYNTKNGLFVSNITKNEFLNIENDFKKADIKALKNSYEANWTDDETINITFIKGNKIVKTISDYGREAPNELIWAYIPLRHLYEQIKLNPYKPINSIPSLKHISFKTTEKICELRKSESFFLLTELFKSKPVKAEFNHKYKIGFRNNNDQQEMIYTDGRYFKIKKITYDLEYNFLTANQLQNRFRGIPEYD